VTRRRNKKILLALSLLLANFRADGQVLIALLFGDALNTGKIEFGLDGGLNLVTMSGIDHTKMVTTWNLGFYFDVKLPDSSWMIHTGVIVKSTMGTKNVPLYPTGDGNLDAALSGGSVTTSLNYFNVPIMVKHKFPNNFFVEGGAMLGLLYGATDEFINTVEKEDDLTYERNVRSAYHPLDAGMIVGVGYRLLSGNGINLGVRYYYGLVDVYIDDSTPSQYNQSLYFTVGIPIGAGKDPAEDKE
jgi:hypothetical protein